MGFKKVIGGAGLVQVPAASTSSGTVTNTGGNLTANAVVLGAGGSDTKVSVGITSNGGSTFNLGVSGSAQGGLMLFSIGGGGILLVAPSGSIGSTTLLFPVANGDTLVGKATTDTLSNKTLASPTVTGTLTANTGTNLFGPLVDAVDGTTPLNNINQVIASGTAYTMTTSYAAVAFGTTSPVVTIANAGTYAVYVDLQINLVSATTTTQSASFKLSRTNNTGADLAGSTFGSILPVATLGTELGPCIHIGPIKYITTNTNDALTVQGILSASLGAGTVTITNVTITAIRLY